MTQTLSRSLDFNQILHVSCSQIKTFLICPQKYYYQYVRRIQMDFIPDFFPFGKAIHYAVKIFYQTLKDTNERMPLEALLHEFHRIWEEETKKNIRYKDNQNKDTLQEKGDQMLEVFYNTVNPQKILEVEIPFSLDLISEETGEVLPYKLVGIFDLLEEDEEGNCVVVELKTGSKRYSDDRTELDLQATLYSYAANQLGFQTTGKETLVRYDVLLKQKKPAMESYFAVRGKGHYEWTFHLIERVLTAIAQEIFYPITGWQCKDCPFADICLPQ